jgi:hypothetical protein
LTPSVLANLLASPGQTERLVILERAKRKLLSPRLKVRQLDAETPDPGERPSAYGVYLLSWSADT